MKLSLRSALPALAGLLLMSLLPGCGGSSQSKSIPSTEQVFYVHTVLFGNHSTLQAAGYNAFGQLGEGTLITPNWFVQNIASNIGPVRGYASGANHTLAFTNNSTIWAWGCNYRGRLGVDTAFKLPTSGSSAYSSIPLPIKMPDTVRGVAAGWMHSLALVGPNGTVYSWGANSVGQLGTGPINKALPDFASPVQVKGPNDTGVLDHVTKIAAGGSHSLALTESGDVYAWGENLYTQLGTQNTGTATYIPIPVKVQFPAAANIGTSEGQRTIVDIYAAGSYSMVRLDNGEVWGWGYNQYGQLGYAPTTVLVFTWTPTRVMEDATTPFHAAKLSLGLMHVLALKADPATGLSNGQVWSWGFGERGQLGGDDGIPTSRPQPGMVTVLAHVAKGPATDIYAFGSQSFARVNGAWWGWGDNAFGELGQQPTEKTVGYKLDPIEFILRQ